MATRNRRRTMAALLVAAGAATVVVRGGIGAVRPPALSTPGSLDGDVEITVAGEDRPPDVLPVVGDVVQAFECRPRQLYLPRSVGTGYSYTGEVLLAAEDGKPIRVMVGPLPPHLSATVRPDAGRAGQAAVIVTYDISAAGKASAPQATSVRLTVAVDRREVEAEIPIFVGEKPS